MISAILLAAGQSKRIPGENKLIKYYKNKPLINYSIDAIKKKFYYIGALGSKKTHTNRCERLKEAGFNNEEINQIHGPIGIKLGGRSAPEIALSIIAQLVSETYKK